MKKNLFIYQHYASHGRMPGRTRHFHMAKAISSAYDTYIIASGYLHDQRKYVIPYRRFQHFSEEEVDGIKFIWVKTFSYVKNNWRRLVNMVDYSIKAIFCKAVIPVKPDIVVSSVAHHFSLLTGYVVSRMYKTPYVIDIGDLWPDALSALGYLNPRSVHYRFIKKLAYVLYRKADGVMCLSGEAKRRLIEIGVRKEKIHIVYPHKEIRAPEVEYERNGNPFTILYAGSFNSVYPLPLLLDVAEGLWMKGIHDIRFVFIGFGHQKDELVRRSKKLNNVDILEPVPQEELCKRYYRKAELFIVAEKNVLFGFPNKLSEYMLCGKPVLMVSPTKYLSNHENGGIFYVNTMTPEEIEANILRAYMMFRDQFDEYYKRGISNRELAQQLFSRESVGSAVMSCFEQATNHRG